MGDGAGAIPASRVSPVSPGARFVNSFIGLALGVILPAQCRYGRCQCCQCQHGKASMANAGVANGQLARPMSLWPVPITGVAMVVMAYAEKADACICR